MAGYWCIDDDSSARAYNPREPFRPPGNSERPYRLYRLLSDLEDLWDAEADPQGQLQGLMPLVSCYIDSNPWLTFDPLQPDPETGWAIQTLYDEPWFPLTVQLVAGLPGATSPVHNHGTWGLVALLAGAEANHLWRRSPTDQQPDRLEAAGNINFGAGDIVTFLPEAIHRITVQGDRPSLSFNLYGATDFDRRYQFDLLTDRAELF